MGASTRGIVNFSAGEISPKLKGRYDTVPYFAAAEILENVVITNYGGFYRRPGSRHVARARTQAKKSRLIPFKFSAQQSFALELSEGFVRLLRNGASVVETAKVITGITQANPAVVTSNAHGYANGDFVDIEAVGGMTQLNGKRFKVANIAANTFELQTEDGVNVNSTAYGAYTAGGTAERVYQIISPYVEADLPNIKYTQKADLMYLFLETKATRKLSRLGTTNWTLTQPQFENGPYLPVNVTATTITPSADTVGVGRTLTASTAIFLAGHVGSSWRIKNGWVVVTAFTDTTHVTVEVKEALGTGPAATEDWSEGSWSAVRGYPRDGKFQDQRLHLIASTYQPLQVWESVVGEYENMTTGADDSDARDYEVGSATVDSLLWIYPTQVLNIGSQAGPFTFDSSEIVPKARLQNENGASSVSPVRIGPFVYYVERDNKTMGEFAYNLDTDSYRTGNMTLLADHILSSGVNYMDLANYPANTLWVARNDGVLATLTREVDQEIKAWCRQIVAGTNAVVESVCVIPNGVEDQIWIVVKRTINGGTKRYIEYFETVDFGTNQADCFFVDSGLTYEGAPATIMTNLDHLEGETVTILADGAVHPTKVVTNGSVTLDRAASKVHIGLPYTSRVKTMDLEGGSATGTSQTKVTHIGKMAIRFVDSLGCKFGDGTTMDTISFRTNSMQMDAPPTLFSGDKEVQFPSGHVKNKHIVITQDQPLPLHVLGIFPRLMVSD